MTKEEYQEYITDTLNDKGIKTFTEFEKTEEYFIILLRGKRVRVKSGKMAWSSLGAAKNALRCNLGCIPYDYQKFISDVEDNRDYIVTEKAKREAENEWIKNNIVFMPLAQYMLFRKKTKKG
ncbi:hypothetical protein LCGC14_1789710 [marine sediment metagenome]|uniref:Uncharacterized protein n=1 Tax=marine sediment metagenome TaxID=412755 RepID=A0A0F9J7S8_9ZZZZ